MNMIKEEKRFAAEINDLFFQLSEILWEHVAESDIFCEKKTSFSFIEHLLIEFLGKESFASMSKLSSFFHVAPTTMTSIVDRLTKKGFLNRRRAQQDRRKVLVTLSEKGKTLYSDHQQQSTENYALLLSKLPDKGKRFRQDLINIKRNISLIKNSID